MIWFNFVYRRGFGYIVSQNEYTIASTSILAAQEVFTFECKIRVNNHYQRKKRIV